MWSGSPVDSYFQPLRLGRQSLFLFFRITELENQCSNRLVGRLEEIDHISRAAP